MALYRWGATIIHTRHSPPPAQRRPLPLPVTGSAGWELVPTGLGADHVVDAHGLDAFTSSPLSSLLAGLGLDHLIVCGLGLEGPVHSTLRSANDQGLECLLLTDGCAPWDADLVPSAINTIEMSGGIFGAVASSALLLPALQEGDLNVRTG